jgi:hypothetical protein
VNTYFGGMFIVLATALSVAGMLAVRPQVGFESSSATTK